MLRFGILKIRKRGNKKCKCRTIKLFIDISQALISLQCINLSVNVYFCRVENNKNDFFLLNIYILSHIKR